MKTKRLSIRISEEIKNKIEEKAKFHKTTISHFMISMFQNKAIKVQSLPDEHALKLKGEINTIGKNIWILIKFNKTLKLSEKIQLQTLIEELRMTLKSINTYYGC